MSDVPIFDLKMFSKTESVVCTKSRAYDALLPHSHNFIELSMVVSGKGIHELGKEKYEIFKLEGYLIVDATEHNVAPIADEEGLEIINIIFDQSFIGEDRFLILENQKFSGNEYIKGLFIKAYEEFERKEFGYLEIIRFILLQILYFFQRSVIISERSMQETRVKRILRKEEIVGLVVDYIQQHYKEDIKVEEIAKHLGIGLSTMQKIFKNEKDTTVKKTIIKQKITVACKLLIESDYSVQIIGEKVGVNDLKNFYKSFREITGMTPNEYRLSHKFPKKEIEI